MCPSRFWPPSDWRMYRPAAPSDDAVAGAAGDSAVAPGILFTSLPRLVGITESG